MGLWDLFRAQQQRPVHCDVCGQPFHAKGQVAPPYICAKCRTHDIAQGEIDLWRGVRADPLPPLPSIRNNARVIQPWHEAPEEDDGSHLCPHCGGRLWRQILAALRPMEVEMAAEPGEIIILAGRNKTTYEPGTQMLHDECPNPECEVGWNAVRKGQRDASGFTPDLCPPWSQGDEEYHERWWAAYQAALHTNAGKGVNLVGRFGDLTRLDKE